MQYGAHDHKTPSEGHAAEYVKLALVLLAVTGFAWLHADSKGISVQQYLESFMGVFFLIFASFKLINLKVFAHGLQSYAGFEHRSLIWGYAYPFVQVLFGLLYIFGFGSSVLDGIVFMWSSYGAYVVWKTLQKEGDFHCVCLGNVIKLPLSTVSFIEDFGMAVMAAVMFILR